MKAVIIVGIVVYVFYYVAMVAQTLPIEGAVGSHSFVGMGVFAILSVACYLLWSQHSNRRAVAAEKKRAEALENPEEKAKAMRLIAEEMSAMEASRQRRLRGLHHVGLAAVAVVALVLVAPTSAKDFASDAEQRDMAVGLITAENQGEEVQSQELAAVLFAPWAERIQGQAQEWYQTLQNRIAWAVGQKAEEHAQMQAASVGKNGYVAQETGATGVDIMRLLQKGMEKDSDTNVKWETTRVQFQEQATGVSFHAAAPGAHASIAAMGQRPQGKLNPVRRWLDTVADQVGNQLEQTLGRLSYAQKRFVAIAREAVAVARAEGDEGEIAQGPLSHPELEGKQMISVENSLALLSQAAVKNLDQPWMNEGQLTHEKGLVILRNATEKDGMPPSRDDEEAKREMSKLTH